MTTPVALKEVLSAFRRGWMTLVAVHLAVAAVAAAVIGPLGALVLQGVVSWSGQAALSDTAITDFVLSPMGAVIGLGMASVWLTIQMLGYSAQLVPARALLSGREARLAEVPLVLGPALPQLLRVSLRFVIWFGLWSLPFLGMYAAIYAGLLRENDINYYLVEKPREFWWAVGWAAGVGLAHAVAVSRLATGWVHALPLVVFRGASPGAALRLSGRAAVGQRKWIFGGLVLWALGAPLVGSLLNLPWSAFALWAADHLHRQPSALVAALGLAVALSLATGWLIGFACESLIVLHHMRLYRLAGLDRESKRDGATTRSLPGGFKPALAGGFSLCAVTSFLSFQWLESLHTEHPAVIIAHRGASAAAPENTLAAVRAAVEAGADWVEIDVQESADGTVFVFHDKDFKRFRGPGRPIWELRDGEIDAIDIGSWKSPEFAAERAPRLADVLALCKNRSGVLIELKYYGHAQRLEERVVALVEAAGMADQVMVMSLSHTGVRTIRQLRPQWKVGLLSTVALGDVTRLDVDFLGLNARTATRPLLRSASRRGLKVHVWTVNRSLDMAVQLSRGVDGLITDDPALARAVLAERAEANFPEKLLLTVAAMTGTPPPPSSQ
jgi:glycerophosphoryl diester phosphodiesterase